MQDEGSWSPFLVYKTPIQLIVGSDQHSNFVVVRHVLSPLCVYLLSITGAPDVTACNKIPRPFPFIFVHWKQPNWSKQRLVKFAASWVSCTCVFSLHREWAVHVYFRCIVSELYISWVVSPACTLFSCCCYPLVSQQNKCRPGIVSTLNSTRPQIVDALQQAAKKNYSCGIWLKKYGT